MTGAPIGNIVKLYFDTPHTLEEGMVVRNAETRRSYRIVEVRQQTRGIHEGRWHVQGLVIDPDTITEDDDVWEYVWYSRARRRRTP